MDVAAAFDVVVFDYDGVCTPSAAEFIANETTPLGPLRPRLASIIAEFRKRRTIVVLLSNEFDRRWIPGIDGFPDFDHVFVGSDNRIFKPDRRAFQRVLHVTGCEARRCLVIDDDDVNVQVARSLGCSGVHFDVSNVADSWDAVLASADSPPRCDRTGP